MVLASLVNTQCPCCGLLWERKSEQHASIELFGECICCRFMPDGKGTRSGTQDDLDRIQAKRRALIDAAQQPEAKA
jgi:hypothetical protein